MERRILGSTGLSVTVMGLGTGQFGAFGQMSENDSLRIAHAAFDGGINLIDTADFYSFGEAETFVGKAIADRRDKIILATKCGMPMSDDANEGGGSRRWIMASVDRSLGRLKTDYIDVYQLHQPDPATEVEETIDAMNDLVRAGKIRYFGTSNFSGQLISETQLRARLRGLVAPHSEQSPYSIFNRAPEAELLPSCVKYDIGFLAYSPLDGGWLSGKYQRDQRVIPSARHRLQPGKFDLQAQPNERKLAAAEALSMLAQEAGVALSHMAIGFVLAHKAVTCALVGASKPEHIETHLRGQDVILSDEMLDRIDTIMPPGSNLPQMDPYTTALADKNLRRRRRQAPQTDRAIMGLRFIRRLIQTEQQGK